MPPQGYASGAQHRVRAAPGVEVVYTYGEFIKDNPLQNVGPRDPMPQPGRYRRGDEWGGRNHGVNARPSYNGPRTSRFWKGGPSHAPQSEGGEARERWHYKHWEREERPRTSSFWQDGSSHVPQTGGEGVHEKRHREEWHRQEGSRATYATKWGKAVECDSSTEESSDEDSRDPSSAPSPSPPPRRRKHYTKEKRPPISDDVDSAKTAPLDHYAVLGISPDATAKELVHLINRDDDRIADDVVASRQLERKCAYRHTQTGFWSQA